jgi:lactoylglutathione lyase/glyoxylase I family protein
VVAPETRPQFSDLLESLHLGGYHHLCLTVDSVDATVKELRRRGVAILGGPFDRESISRRLAFFADPWGNLIELAQVLR